MPTIDSARQNMNIAKEELLADCPLLLWILFNNALGHSFINSPLDFYEEA